MQTIRVIFTRRTWNPVSWLIRWAVPRSRFAWALSSHCLIVDGDYMIEAHMIYGVRRARASDALNGLTTVQTVDYSVPDAEAGLTWARGQVCGYSYARPGWMPAWICPTVAAVMLALHNNYDWRGAFGTALTPWRDWFDPVSWFCYELGAGALRAAGRDAFAHTGYITESTLLSIKP